MTSIKLPTLTDKHTSRASSIDTQARHDQNSTATAKQTNSKPLNPNIKNNTHPQQPPSNQQTSTALAANAVLQPVKVINQDITASNNPVKTDIISVDIDGKTFQFKANEQINQLIQVGAKIMLNAEHLNQLKALSTLSPANQQQLMTQIVLVAKAIKFNLPSEILSLAQLNGVSPEQLLSLASRPKGYPLPLVEINANRLQFENGTNIMVSPLNKLPSGLNLAQVTQFAGQLQLQLNLIKLIENVNLGPATDKATSIPIPLNSETVISKYEPAQLLTQFLTKLERIPFNQHDVNSAVGNKLPLTDISRTITQNINALINEPQKRQNFEQLKNLLSEFKTGELQAIRLNKLGINQFKQLNLHINQSLLKTENTLTTSQASELKLLLNKLNPELITTNSQTKIAGSSKSPFEVLNQNLSKAGAMPSDVKETNGQQNLATQLLKLMPKFDPSPLTELANPALLKAELTSLASLNLSQTALAPNINLTGGAITTLFQLLLGFKLKGSNTTMSPRLQTYMAKLQQKLFNSNSLAPQLLAALDKAGSMESIGKLANSISLYQHSSSEVNQNLTWYFALPYSIGQRDEQLEGKFEKEPNETNDDENTAWRLQLKFNLAEGPLLIMAHKQGEYLDLTFTGNDMQVLSKIDQFHSSLAEKIQQAGLQARNITTQVDTVPATLLPGDHYLVKTNA